MTTTDPAEVATTPTHQHGPGCGHERTAPEAPPAPVDPTGWRPGATEPTTSIGRWFAARPWAKPVAVGLGLGTAALYTGLVDPNTSHAFPLCPLKYLTGADCPACGGLRATHALMHGQIGTAMDHNVVFVLAVPFILVAYGRWLWRSVGHEVKPTRVPYRFLVALIGLVILFGIVRNLPIPGHAFLDSAA